jgi:type IV pilus assembly protein PilW
VLPGCVDDAVPGSDVLIIKHAIPRIRSDIDCGGGGGLPQSGVFLMTNNVRGLLFECQDGGPTTTVGGDIPGGVLWQYQVEVFYVRDAETPVLARKTLIWNGAAMELRGEDMVDGVEFLHLLFGFDGTGDGEVDSYATVDGMAAGDWDAVESVEIRLLLRSARPDGTYSNTKTYLLPGRPDYAPADNFRRLLLSTRVSLRNPQFVLRGNA